QHAHAFRLKASRAELACKLERVQSSAARLTVLTLDQESFAIADIDQELVPEVTDARCEIERLLQVLASSARSTEVNLSDGKHGQVREEHAHEVLTACFLDALREMASRRDHLPALIVGIAQATERACNLQRRAG